MASQSRPLKKVLRIFLILVALGLVWLGWQLWMVQGQLSIVHWVTADGGLEINHMPGKRLTHLRVNSSYSSQAERVWIKAHPGATERWLGRIEVPSPDELLKHAFVHVKDSNLAALCRFYPDATERQRSDIRYHLHELGDGGKLPADMLECLDVVALPVPTPGMPTRP